MLHSIIMLQGELFLVFEALFWMPWPFPLDCIKIHHSGWALGRLQMCICTISLWPAIRHFDQMLLYQLQGDFTPPSPQERIPSGETQPIDIHLDMYASKTVSDIFQGIKSASVSSSQNFKWAWNAFWSPFSVIALGFSPTVYRGSAKNGLMSTFRFPDEMWFYYKWL